MIFDRLREFALVRKVREFTENFRVKSPLQKRIFFEKMAGCFLKTNGINIFAADYKVTWYSFINSVLGFDCYVSILYTIYFYRNDFTIALRSIGWISSITTVNLLYLYLIISCVGENNGGIAKF